MKATKLMSNTTERSVEAFSSCDRVVVHSGNIASWNKLRKRGVLTSTAEVRAAPTYVKPSLYTI